MLLEGVHRLYPRAIFGFVCFMFAMSFSDLFPTATAVLIAAALIPLLARHTQIDHLINWICTTFIAAMLGYRHWFVGAITMFTWCGIGAIASYHPKPSRQSIRMSLSNDTVVSEIIEIAYQLGLTFDKIEKCHTTDRSVTLTYYTSSMINHLFIRNTIALQGVSSVIRVE